ncbi:MAG: exodeoxyribonuclease VII large subunit [Spirochaetae bacterium HGW-Spirochaetae-5]|nr:MAG: exodeoxyribonuclease VII large subunit [Spirochaetae bacterium HGW-Spirochaetae-5]
MEEEVKPRIYTVAQINGLIKSEVENNPYLSSIWISGEVYNLTYHSSGHIYFTLKDDASSISAVFFKYANKNLKFKLEDGMKILVFGGITVFEKRGSYQLNVLSARPDGAGELQKRIEQLKKKLGDEGLFDPSRKRKLPFLPARLGIVTSPTGAAVRDIIKVALRRYSNIEIIIAPAKVQGDDAAATIAAAIKELNKPQWNIDVIIAGRGGGSFEDLMPFNEEVVIRAFAESRVPIISAVGHQIDHPLSDDAADVAAPTPSAAAELAVPVKTDLINEIEYLKTRMSNSLTNNYQSYKTALKNLITKKIFRDPYEILNSRQMLLADAENRMINQMKHRVASEREKLLRLPDIYRLQKKFLVQKKHDLELLIQNLNNLSPLNIMSRGYSVVLDRSRKLIKSVDKLKQGDTVEIKFADGAAEAVISSVIKEN